jgi:hypothetical protein
LRREEKSVAQRRGGEVLLRVGVALLVASFLWAFPKERVMGGLRSGPIGPDEAAYREDYLCLGVRYDFCPNWPDYGCDRLCFGAVVARTCSIETYDSDVGLLRAPAVCRGPARPGWGFPEH